MTKLNPQRKIVKFYGGKKNKGKKMDYRDILQGGSVLTEGDEILAVEQQRFTWGSIKRALLANGLDEKKCKEILEATTASAVGAYDPPLAFTTRRDKFSTNDALSKQFHQCVQNSGRKELLGQCRKMGLSIGHLKTDDVRKTLLGMSLRNKKKYLGVATGIGNGAIANRARDSWK